MLITKAPGPRSVSRTGPWPGHGTRHKSPFPAIDHLQGVGQFDCGSNPYWKTGERGRIFPKWRQLSDVTIAAPSTIALTRSSWCRTLVTYPVRSAVTR